MDVQRRFAAGIATVSTVGAVLVGVAPADAAEADPLAVVAAATPETVANAAPVTTTDTGVNAVDANVAGAEVTVPVDPAAGIAMGSGASTVSIGLPFAGQADDASVEKPGVVSYDNNNGSTTVPIVQNDGSVQINTVIQNAAAPTRYAYPIRVPAGQSLRLNADGSASVTDAAGEPTVYVAAPWAKDALGQPVSTHYEIAGDALIQVVERGIDTVYPVVADPKYLLTTYWLSRSDVERMWNTLQTINTLCTWIPLPYAASVTCGPGAALADSVASAHYQKKRIKAVYHNCGFTYCNYYDYSVVS